MPEVRAGPGAAATPGKYLTFLLGAQSFCVPTTRVREISPMMPLTPVPNTPRYVRGVANLRGRIIPAIDLRMRLGMPEHEYGSRTCVIWLDVRVEGSLVAMGIIVDTVSEVIDVAAPDLSHTPALGPSLCTTPLLGVATSAGDVHLILDVDRVMAEVEVGAGQQGADGAGGTTTGRR